VREEPRAQLVQHVCADARREVLAHERREGLRQEERQQAPDDGGHERVIAGQDGIVDEKSEAQWQQQIEGGRDEQTPANDQARQPVGTQKAGAAAQHGACPGDICLGLLQAFDPRCFDRLGRGAADAEKRGLGRRWVDGHNQPPHLCDAELGQQKTYQRAGYARVNLGCQLAAAGQQRGDVDIVGGEVALNVLASWWWVGEGQAHQTVQQRRGSNAVAKKGFGDGVFQTYRGRILPVRGDDATRTFDDEHLCAAAGADGEVRQKDRNRLG